jgi:DNA-directed RNA polymerase specialized sigma24 family protein
MPAPKALKPEEEREVVERYSTGESALSISRVFGVSNSTISLILRRHGIAVRPEFTKRTLADEQRERVIEACLGGMNAKEAAQLFGVSTKTIFRILEGNGVQLKKGRPRKHVVK